MLGSGHGSQQDGGPSQTHRVYLNPPSRERSECLLSSLSTLPSPAPVLLSVPGLEHGVGHVITEFVGRSYASSWRPSPARGTIQHSGSFGACKSAELPKYTATSHHQSYVVLLGRIRNHVSPRRHQSISSTRQIRIPRFFRLPIYRSHPKARSSPKFE